MISYKLFSHFEPLGTMIREALCLFDIMTPLFHIKDATWRPFGFQKKVKTTLSQAFQAIYI